jgi:hypothetical protein
LMRFRRTTHVTSKHFSLTCIVQSRSIYPCSTHINDDLYRFDLSTLAYGAIIHIAKKS